MVTALAFTLTFMHSGDAFIQKVFVLTIHAFPRNQTHDLQKLID